MNFVSGWMARKTVADLIPNVSLCHSKFILTTFRDAESSLNQKQGCTLWKIGSEKGCRFFDFVGFDGHHST